MVLLERASYLAELNGLLRQATDGHGHLLFLGGEAGIGKTALVQQFAGQVRSTTRVLTGSCDPLSTPQPLGPLIDIGDIVGGDIAALPRTSSPRSDLFKAVLADLAAHPATLMIIEDAHWADEATLDLLRYLGRRLGSAPALVIVTYRDDEVGGGHPLRRVLGDLATAGPVRRLGLRSLSLDAVTRMAAGSGIDPAELYVQTGGNPFFVTEVLALGETGVPPTVRDAVLARASGLTPKEKQVLEACAVIGSPIEPWLLERVRDSADSVAECLDRGILVDAGPNLAFRHELARQAVLDAVTPVAKLELHRRVLATLRGAATPDLARLAHHAEEAGDGQSVLEFAPAAAERAAALRSHREAAAQYARTLRFADVLPPEQRAELLEAQSYECYLTGQLVDAVNSCETALDIWRTVGDRLKEGDTLRKLSRLLWVSGRNLDAQGASLKATSILEELPAGPELAMAYSNLSQLRMLAWYSDEAIAWGEKAIDLSERLGAFETLVHALNNVGSARFMIDSERGRQEIERSLQLAMQHGYEDHAARAYAGLGCNYCEMFEFSRADRYLSEGIAYCTEHDLELMRLYLLSWRAISLMYQGQWVEATSIAESVRSQGKLSPVSHIMALVALGRIQVRQGNPKAVSTLDQALDLASPIGELQRLGPVRAARAEAAWLAGDLVSTLAEATDHFEIAVSSKHQWLVGELAFWRWRAGHLKAPPEGAFEPFALQISGNWRQAAAHWRSLGCPYETASALADSDDEADLRYALAEFKRLGAGPAAAMVSARLRAMTERRIRHQLPRPESVFTIPETRYAKSGDVNIAYQVAGDGPFDLVFVMGWISNVELFWEGPSAQFLQRLASFSRLIIFDKRGTGLSDRVTELPTMEQRMDDVRAVMEAANCQRAALFGISEGAAMCALFAATFPEKTAALIVYGGYAKRIWAPDYPWAPTPVERQSFYSAIEHGWGGVVDLETLAPSAAVDPQFRRWWSAYLRRSASPGAALALARMNTEIDIRHILPAIRVPTLILHRTGDLDIDVGGARFMAEQIPDARYVELPGVDHLAFAGDQDAILDEVELFLTGALPVPQEDRVLATVAVVEIAGAAERAASLPVGHWRANQDAFERQVEEELVRFRGTRITSTPSGFSAAFDGPGRAIRFANGIAGVAERLGLQTRTGLHTGECERLDGELTGIPLHLAAAIMAHAPPGEVVVSSTVKDLVAGSGIEFERLGNLLVDEPPGELPLYQVIRESRPPAASVGKFMPIVEKDGDTSNPLSRRETEIAILIAGGLSNRQIAEELSISPATAERHVSNIFNKLGYHARSQIAAWAVEHNLTASSR